jgi:hypothetical protein
MERPPATAAAVVSPGVRYVGIDWAYRRPARCVVRDGGEIAEEGLVAADEEGLAELVLRAGPEVSACVEMMSGAVGYAIGSGRRAGRWRWPMPAR